MKFILSILLLITCSLSNAQNYYSENITSKNGLPNNAIRSLFQDSRGFMWIGTDAGVSRWDGETFITYNTLDGLAGNKVWWIDEDNKGNLWFACFGAGISKFDGLIFTSYSSSDGLVDNSVRVVKYSPDFDCLLIGTNKAISAFKDTVFYNFSSEKGDMDKMVIITSILSNQKEAVFFDFLGNTYILKQDSVKIFIIEKTARKLLNKYFASSAITSSEGDTIIGWRREGVAIKRKDSTIEIPAIGQVFGIVEDNQSNLWAASWNGNDLAPPGGLFLIKDAKPFPMNQPYKMKSIQGWSLFFESNQNLIFYGTLNNGLYKIPPKYFEYYPPAFFNKNDLSVKGLKIDNNDHKWLFTDSLLIFWDGNKTEKIELKEFFNSRYQYEKSVSNSENLKQNIQKLKSAYKNNTIGIDDIELDKNNRIWIEINMLGLFNLPQNNPEKKPVYIANIGADFAFNNEDTLFQCHRWSKHLTKYHDFKNSYKVTKYVDSLNPVMLKKMVNHKNEIWLFSRIAGVFLYNEGVYRTITSEDVSINKIVNDICFDALGTAYLAGNDGRIEVLDNKTRQKIFEINPTDHNGPVLWIDISNNMLMAGYADGMKVFQLEDVNNRIFRPQYFSFSDGYPHQLVTDSEIDEMGNIWLTTTDGLVKINTKLLVEFQSKPLQTIIEKVELLTKKTDWSRFAETSNWSRLPLEPPKLNSEQNHISIYFQTLNFNNPEADMHYYKIDNIDDDWNVATNKNYVVYPYLAPGKYTFRVKSKNERTGLFSNTAEFSFTILKPWFKQIWFIVLMIVLLVAIIITAYNLRVNNIREEEKEKRQILLKISELEYKALQAQMNPHFLFNAISSIQDYVLDHNVDDALTYLSSFSKIIRMTLEFVDTKFVKLSEVLTYLEHYVKLENMRFEDLFEYNVICDKDIDPETTQIPPMILQTLIENSINHGIRPLKGTGKITLQFIKINNDTFKCSIEDNGIGRKKSAQINKDQNLNKESRGLKIICERIELLNKGKTEPFKMELIDLYTASGEAKGTRVEITIPFATNNYK